MKFKYSKLDLSLKVIALVETFSENKWHLLVFRKSVLTINNPRYVHVGRIQATQTILLVIMTDASVPEKPPHATTNKFVVFTFGFRD